MFHDRRGAPDPNLSQVNQLASEVRDRALAAVGIDRDTNEFLSYRLEPNSGLRVYVTTFFVNCATDTRIELCLPTERGNFEATFSRLTELTKISLADATLYPPRSHASGDSSSPQLEALARLLTEVRNSL